MKTVPEIIAEIDRRIKIFLAYENEARKYNDIKLMLEFNQRVVDLDQIKSFILGDHLTVLTTNGEECQHKSDGLTYTSHPAQYKCVKCGEYYR